MNEKTNEKESVDNSVEIENSLKQLLEKVSKKPISKI
jgi:hypothetical protein